MWAWKGHNGFAITVTGAGTGQAATTPIGPREVGGAVAVTCPLVSCQGLSVVKPEDKQVIDSHAGLPGP